jgi:putative hydrolase of the HAD superfamily
MANYDHVFFDLDRTLWDFERNSLETIHDLYHEFELVHKNVPSFDEFIGVYRVVNHDLWARYRVGKVTKDELRQLRFHLALQHFHIDDEKMALKFNDRYVETCSVKPHLLPDALTTLEYLNDRYHLHIITNGFKEAQFVKLKNSGIEQFFKEVIISELYGKAKPHQDIFTHAFDRSGAVAKHSIMIGDDFEADIVGAQKAGMDSVYLADFPKKSIIKPTHHIKGLIELKGIL